MTLLNIHSKLDKDPMYLIPVKGLKFVLQNDSFTSGAAHMSNKCRKIIWGRIWTMFKTNRHSW